MKLRNRLYTLVAATVVPMVVFAGIAAYQMHQTMRSAALQGIKETANSTALIIDREITAAITSVKVLANSPLIAEADWKRFYELASSATSASGGWVILYEPDGKQVINTRMPYGSSLPSRTVSIKISEILRHSTPQVSGMTWSPMLKRNIVLVDYPIRASDGRQYVLSQAFFAEHFSVAVTDRGLPKTWAVRIFDKSGITISHSFGADYIGKPANTDTFNALNMGRDIALRHFIRGNVEVFDVITRSGLSGWSIAVGIPVNEINAMLNKSVIMAISGLLIALITAIGVAAYIGSGFSKSIRSAAKSSTAIGLDEPVLLPKATGILELDALQQAIYAAGQALVVAKEGRKDAELKNAALLKSEQEARRRADIENKRKDEFLAMLGHELRNPLSAITSASSMLTMKAATPEGALKMAAIIQRQSGHLRNILDDLLDLSRVMYGKVILEPSALNLETLIKNSIEVLVDTGKLSEYDFSFKSEPVQIHGDETRIEQIFSNVIHNAMKYTPAGGSISVDIKVDRNDALITVADAGVGIDPELMPFIFDVFVQGDHSLARTKGGMGVGLSLARKLVELHLGSIDVHCDGIGKGCTFFIRFPLNKTGAETSSDETVLAQSVASYSILLVEDQDDGREMMEMLLTSLGHRVTTASNGEQALNLALEMPDIVISDIGLPEMDGYELARKLRKNPELARIKLVALSGYGLTEDKQKAKDSGFDFHLTKPLRLSELQICLNFLYARRGT